MSGFTMARAVRAVSLCVLAVTAVVVAQQVQAQDRRIMREREHERARFETQHWRWDNRFNHNHYYPSFGYAVPVLPSGHRVITYGGARYYFHSGVWFRYSGGRYLVIRPPLGVIVPALPVGFTPLWFRGVRYFYVNDVYYQQTPEGYAVVEPPADAAWDMQPPAAQPYPAPVQQGYPPAAQPYPPPVTQTAPPQYSTNAPTPGVWYYCDPSGAYYPHVATCSEPWRQVPATPPPPPR